MIKKFIKNLLSFLNWKLVKKKQKKAKSFFYPRPNLVEIKTILNSSGILHIGAHRGAEATVYNWLNKKVLWIEANPEIYEDLESNISIFYKQMCFNKLLGDKDNKKINFFLSNKDSSLSSIYDFHNDVKKNKVWKEHNVEMKKKINLEMTRLDTFLKNEKINISDYNHWVIDVQGSELLVLKGAINSLKMCKSINIEISKINYYKNAYLWKDIKKFLNKHKFIETNQPKLDHCDILFLKK